MACQDFVLCSMVSQSRKPLWVASAYRMHAAADWHLSSINRFGDRAKPHRWTRNASKITFQEYLQGLKYWQHSPLKRSTSETILPFQLNVKYTAFSMSSYCPAATLNESEIILEGKKCLYSRFDGNIPS